MCPSCDTYGLRQIIWNRIRNLLSSSWKTFNFPHIFMLASLWESIQQCYFYCGTQLSHSQNRICRRTPRQSETCLLVLPSLLHQLLCLTAENCIFSHQFLQLFRALASATAGCGKWCWGNLRNGWEMERETLSNHVKHTCEATACHYGHGCVSVSVSISSRTIGSLSPTELVPARCLYRK